MPGKVFIDFAHPRFAGALAVLAALFAGLFAVHAVSGAIPPAVLVVSVLLGGWLVLASAIDSVSCRLPDWTTLPLAGAGLIVIAGLAPERVALHVAALVGGYLLIVAIAWCYRRLRSRDGVGAGDAKLLGAAGAWVGPDGLPSVLLVASVSALSLLAVARVAGVKLDAEQRIPFGPFLALGLYWVWLMGPLVG